MKCILKSTLLSVSAILISKPPLLESDSFASPFSHRRYTAVVVEVRIWVDKLNVIYDLEGHQVSNIMQQISIYLLSGYQCKDILPSVHTNDILPFV